MSETYQTPGMFDNHMGIVIGPRLTGDSDDIGLITVDSDQPNQGASVALVAGVTLRARSGNTNNVRFRFDSGSDSGGFELAPNEKQFVNVPNLNKLWFTTDTVGNEINWLKA